MTYPSPLVEKDRLITLLWVSYRKFQAHLIATDFILAHPNVLRGWTLTLSDAERQESAHINLDGLHRVLGDPDASRTLRLETEGAARRTFFLEVRELLSDYCEETRQVPTHVAQPWYRFGQVMRNCVAHGRGGVLHRWPDKLFQAGIVDVHWRHRTLSKAMIGRLITFTALDCVEWFHDMHAFAQDVLE